MRLTASLVLFHSDPALYGVAMDHFLAGTDGELHVVDNSAAPLAHDLFSHPRVRYEFNGANVGFGRAHNRALARIGDRSDVHLFLNPDVEFGAGVVEFLMRRMREDADIGALMPRIEYPDGSLQRVCKLLPTPIDLVFRRFIPIALLRERINRRYEMYALSQTDPSDVPTLSGCFLMARTSLLKQVGGFDERFFMYMEDIDLVRRIGTIARTIYEPTVVVRHHYAKGSYVDPRLLRHHLRSACQYFNKWGWLIDPERSARNRRMLARLRR
ncbi:MAG: glycosyltransferase [Steroidobacteraceae bacterium]